MDLRDSEAFWPSFEGFARFLADTFPEEVRLGTRPYKKVPLITFKTETMSTFVQPSFCVMDGKLIVSTSSSSEECTAELLMFASHHFVDLVE